jgi:hypothetical protein
VLALRLALDRVTGVLVPLESALSHYTAELRRSDPRMSSVGRNSGVELSGQLQTPSSPLATLDGHECRQIADEMRGVLREAMTAARAVQQSIQGARGSDGETLAGAIEQTQTLVAWLRQHHERIAGTLVHAVVARPAH